MSPQVAFPPYTLWVARRIGHNAKLNDHGFQPLAAMQFFQIQEAYPPLFGSRYYFASTFLAPLSFFEPRPILYDERAAPPQAF